MTSGLKAERRMVHLMVEMLVQSELWKSSGPASLLKEDCCHHYIGSAVPLLLLKSFKDGESEGENGGMVAPGTPMKSMMRCPRRMRTHDCMAALCWEKCKELKLSCVKSREGTSSLVQVGTFSAPKLLLIPSGPVQGTSSELSSLG